MKKLLQVAGAVGLFAWTALGAAAWLATKGQVHVHVSADAPAGGPDPIALLEDQVAGLGLDLQALTGTLGENFSILDRRVQELGGSGASHGEPERFAALERELRARIAELEARLRVLEGSAPVAHSSAEPPAAAAEPPAAEEPSAAAPDAAPDPAPSFLAFQLPSRAFERDARRAWTIAPSLSRVGFDGKSTLHDFTGATSAVRGDLVVNPARPTERPTGRIVVDVAALDTGLADRDEEMRKVLDVERFPTIELELTAFDLEHAGAEDDPIGGTVRGEMRIKGRARAFAMPVAVTLDGSHRLVVEGSALLALSDYGVPAPNKLGLVKMEDLVTVWVTLRAKPGAEVR